VLAYYYWFEPSKNSDYGNNKGQIEKLQIQNDSLRKNNQQLDGQLTLLKSETDSLIILVNTDRKKINELKKNENEKLIAIDNFDNNELFDFFSGIKTDSTTY
jgi:cell division protein FtsB